MLEQIQAFVQSIFVPLNDRNTSLFEKLEIIVRHYIDMLISNPNAPIFVLNEVKTDPQQLIERMGLDKMSVELYIVQQWKEYAAQHKVQINPLHIMVNIVAMTIFPFVASPLLKNRTGLTDDQFNALMEERKQLIPMWIKGMIEGGNQK
jgi:hypothetical protein